MTGLGSTHLQLLLRRAALCKGLFMEVCVVFLEEMSEP